MAKLKRMIEPTRKGEIGDRVYEIRHKVLDDSKTKSRPFTEEGMKLKEYLDEIDRAGDWPEISIRNVDIVGNENLKYITIDPGKTTGYAVWEGSLLVTAGQLAQDKFLDFFFGLLEEELVEFVVYESWALSAAKKDAFVGSKFETVQIIGVIKWLSKKAGIKAIEQTPAQKSFFDNDRLKKHGVYVKRLEHARDAVRHGLYFQVFKMKITQLKE